MTRERRAKAEAGRSGDAPGEDDRVPGVLPAQTASFAWSAEIRAKQPKK